MKTKLITLLVGLVLPLASVFASEATTAAAGGPIVIGMSVAWLDPILSRYGGRGRTGGREARRED